MMRNLVSPIMGTAVELIEFGDQLDGRNASIEQKALTRWALGGCF
jgi:hypothetical protein